MIHPEGNTLQELAALTGKVEEAREELRLATNDQIKFVLKNADELVDRRIVSVRVKMSELYRQLERERGHQAVVEAKDRRVIGG